MLPVLKKRVPNRSRGFGEATSYTPALVELDGKKVPALFTDGQIEVAIERASRHPEDAPKAGFFGRLLG